MGEEIKNNKVYLNLFIVTTDEAGLDFSLDLCVKGNLEISILVFGSGEYARLFHQLTYINHKLIYKNNKLMYINHKLMYNVHYIVHLKCMLCIAHTT